MTTHLRNSGPERNQGSATARRTALCSLALVLVVLAGSMPAHGAVDGQRYVAWGENRFGQLGEGGQVATSATATTPSPDPDPEKWNQISGGGYHTIALKNDGTVSAWGDNRRGQLGNGKICNVPNPADCESLVPVPVHGLSGVKQIAAGFYHNLALKTDGSVWAWGDNSYGQLGAGTACPPLCGTNVPVPVVPVSSPVVHVAAGFYHSLAVGGTSTSTMTTDDTVWSWGLNAAGQLGDGSTNNRSLPVAVKGVGGTGTLTGVTKLAGGNSHTLALKDDGTAVSWGSDAYGQLCNGTTTTGNQSSPVVISAETGLTDVAVGGGGFHALLLKSNKQVRACGRNSHGQLGDGTTTDSAAPVAVKAVGGSGNLTNVVAIAGCGFHALAIDGKGTPADTRDDTVAAWGLNGSGQLGNNTTIASSTPVTVKSDDATTDLTGVTAISCGYFHSLALVP